MGRLGRSIHVVFMFRSMFYCYGMGRGHWICVFAFSLLVFASIGDFLGNAGVFKRYVIDMDGLGIET